MLGYIMKRSFQSLVFIFLATLVAYTVLVVLMPGGPARNYATIKDLSSPEWENPKRILEEYYEVDKPWPLNYLAWLFDPTETSYTQQELQAGGIVEKEVPKGADIAIGDFRLRGSGILTGDFNRAGSPSQVGEHVSVLIGKAWVNSALLVGMALIISILIAVPLGIMVAARPHSRLDNLVTLISSLALSLPTYGLGLLLIIALAVIPYYLHTQLGWTWMPNLPPGSPYGLGQENNLLNRLYHLILPALTLAIPQIATLSKYVRSSMLEVLGLDYIRTAWAKGLPAWRVLGIHAFRNALLSFITIVGLILPGIATGAIIVEYLFAYQGMGQLMFTGLGGCVPTETRPCPPGGYTSTDYSLVLALMLVLVVIIAISNMLADIMYAVADPRVKYVSNTRQNR